MNLRKALFLGALAVGISMASITADAAVSASVNGGASYLHLGELTASTCLEVMASPVVSGLMVAVDDRIVEPAKAACRDGVKVDLVSTDPVVTVSTDGIAMWPLDKAACVQVAGAQAEKGVVHVNGKPARTPVEIQSACSQSSNRVVGTR